MWVQGDEQFAECATVCKWESETLTQGFLAPSFTSSSLVPSENSVGAAIPHLESEQRSPNPRQDPDASAPATASSSAFMPPFLSFPTRGRPGVFFPLKLPW